MHVVLHHNPVLPLSHHSSSIEKIRGPSARNTGLTGLSFGRSSNSRERRIGKTRYGLLQPCFGKISHPETLAGLVLEAEKSHWDGFFLSVQTAQGRLKKKFLARGLVR